MAKNVRNGASNKHFHHKCITDTLIEAAQMKLKVSAFKEQRTPINGTRGQPSMRILATIEVETIIGSNKKDVSASSMEGITHGIAEFLGMVDRDDKGFEYNFTFSLGKGNVRFNDGGIMVEQSTLAPDESSQIIRSVDSAMNPIVDIGNG